MFIKKIFASLEKYMSPSINSNFSGWKSTAMIHLIRPESLWFLPDGNKPNDVGIQPTFPAILDTGANNTYVNDSRLISNIKSDSAFVEIADSSRLPITDSGTLINDPIIQANFAPSFSKNLIGTSPTLIDKEVVGIIQSKNNLAKI